MNTSATAMIACLRQKEEPVYGSRGGGRGEVGVGVKGRGGNVGGRWCACSCMMPG